MVGAPRRAEGLLRQNGLDHRLIPWGWSHNGLRPERIAHEIPAVVATNRALVDLLQHERFDLVLSFPGIFTSQAAERCGVAHVCVVHGVYLSGAVRVPQADIIEQAVLDFGRNFFRSQAQRIWDELSKCLDVPSMSYDEWLRDQLLAIVDPLLTLPERSNFIRLPMIAASYGGPPPLRPSALRETCVISFGSGNRCDVSSVVDAAARYFEHVLLCGHRQSRDGRVVSTSHVSHRLLAGRVRACISHGGLGTVAAFARAGTPQLLVPTEIDQATTAVHARRAGLATVVGLESWMTRASLGRRILAQPMQLDVAVNRLSHATEAQPIPTDGADRLADVAVGFAASSAAA